MRIEKNLRFVIIALIILIIFIIIFFQFVVPQVIEQDQRIKGPFKYGFLNSLPELPLDPAKGGQGPVAIFLDPSPLVKGERVDKIC